MPNSEQDIVLAIFAHPDDEALGCGGALARHSARGDRVYAIFMADGEGARASADDESFAARNHATDNAADQLGIEQITRLNWPDNRLDAVPLLDLVQSIEPLIEEIQPTVVYTHFYGDLNVDHQLTAKAVMTACRALPGSRIRKILAAEVLSSTEWGIGDAFQPNYWIDISDYIEAKESALRSYDAEMREYPHTRSYQNCRQLAGVRGAAVGVDYAEAFMLMRQVDK